MTTASHRLDAHQKPPEQLKALFKNYQSASKEEIESDPAIIDFENALTGTSSAKLLRLGVIPTTALLHALDLLSDKAEASDLHNESMLSSHRDASIYQVPALPGQPRQPA